jgi:hypothetical protein
MVMIRNSDTVSEKFNNVEICTNKKYAQKMAHYIIQLLIYSSCWLHYTGCAAVK